VAKLPATAAAFNRMKYAPEDANIKFDYNFAITAVVAIAPVDGQYKPAGQYRWIEDVSYLTLQGAHDMDVSTFHGSRQSEHVRYNAARPVVHRRDLCLSRKSRPVQYRLGPRRCRQTARLAAQSQTAHARRRTAPHLENLYFRVPRSHSQRSREYVPLFEDWRVARAWLPDTLTSIAIATLPTFPSQRSTRTPTLTTTTAPGGYIDGENLSVWNEGKIPYRDGDRGYNGVFLGWNRAKDASAASYSLTIAGRSRCELAFVDELNSRTFDRAARRDVELPGKKKKTKKTRKKQKRRRRKKTNPKRKSASHLNFTIELVTADGTTVSAPVSRFMSIPPPFKEKLAKLEFLNDAALTRIGKRFSSPCAYALRRSLPLTTPNHSIRPNSAWCG